MFLESINAEEVDLNVDLIHARAGSTVAIESCGFWERMKVEDLEVRGIGFRSR